LEPDETARRGPPQRGRCPHCSSASGVRLVIGPVRRSAHCAQPLGNGRRALQSQVSAIDPARQADCGRPSANGSSPSIKTVGEPRKPTRLAFSGVVTRSSLMGTSSRPLSRAASDTRSRAMVQLGQPSKSRIANAADPAYTATDLNATEVTGPWSRRPPPRCASRRWMTKGPPVNSRTRTAPSPGDPTPGPLEVFDAVHLRTTGSGGPSERIVLHHGVQLSHQRSAMAAEGCLSL